MELLWEKFVLNKKMCLYFCLMWVGKLLYTFIINYSFEDDSDNGVKEDI